MCPWLSDEVVGLRQSAVDDSQHVPAFGFLDEDSPVAAGGYLSVDHYWHSVQNPDGGFVAFVNAPAVNR